MVSKVLNEINLLIKLSQKCSIVALVTFLGQTFLGKISRLCSDGKHK